VNPIALHQLIQVEEGEEVVINLSGFDADHIEVSLCFDGMIFIVHDINYILNIILI
jgi:hypothetical protein